MPFSKRLDRLHEVFSQMLKDLRSPMKQNRFFTYCLATLIRLLSFVPASADTRPVTVQRGETIVLTQPHRYEDDCKLIPAKLSLKRNPKLGSVVVQDASYNLGDYGGGKKSSLRTVLTPVQDSRLLDTGALQGRR